MSNNPDQPAAKSTASAAVQLNVEAFRSVRIEMVFCPDGPDTDTTTGLGCNGMADASAFIYRLDDKDHLVTARHNVTGRHWQTNDFLSERFTVNPTHLRVLFFANSPEEWKVSMSKDNPRSGHLQVLFKQYLVPLIGEDWKPIWTQHPQLGGDMDVAVVPFNQPADTMIKSWESTPPRTGPDEAPWPHLSPTQEVFIIGYPYKLSVGPLLPLWVRGTVASDPPFGYQAAGKSYPLWLIDARTRPGNSGAPVMRYRLPGTYVMQNNKLPAVTIGSDSDLVGVYSGRTHDDSDLGFVWRMDEVDEIVATACRVASKPNRSSAPVTRSTRAGWPLLRMPQVRHQGSLGSRTVRGATLAAPGASSARVCQRPHGVKGCRTSRLRYGGAIEDTGDLLPEPFTDGRRKR